ncbi:Sec-independent protein translocase subunit TatA [Streptomyces sp. HK10]|uniref:Sec-independent protein translocase subunit TatA n=1 Tax=Streptomyces sp. HK10 TaxID=3373255 RepID=UPI003748E88F
MVLGISETAILIIVAIVVFGAKKLPELARSAGKSARILKSEVKAMKSDSSPGQSASAPHVIKRMESGPSSAGTDDDSGSGTPR